MVGLLLLHAPSFRSNIKIIKKVSRLDGLVCENTPDQENCHKNFFNMVHVLKVASLGVLIKV